MSDNRIPPYTFSEIRGGRIAPHDGVIRVDLTGDYEKNIFDVAQILIYLD